MKQTHMREEGEFVETAFHPATPEIVRLGLERARINGNRVRLFYGDTKTGRDWFEENDVIGYVSRSCGRIRIPIMLPTKRSSGGGSILDHCIVRMMIDGRDWYRHIGYVDENFDVRPADSDLQAKGYYYSVFDPEGQNRANFKTESSARRYVKFMRGERMSK